MGLRITCPHCGEQVEAPDTTAPFFCAKCHAIVDPAGLMRGSLTPPKAGPWADEPRPPAPRRSEPAPAGTPRPGPSAPPPQYVSRYGTTAPREVAGPGTGVTAGGSLVGGLLLAALAATIVGGGLGWAAAHHLRVPLLYAIATGWTMRRALAMGGGGGTPDKGIAGVLALLGLCVGAFLLGLYAEYDETSDRESAHYRLIFGGGSLEDAEEQLDLVAARDTARTGRVALEDGTTVVLAEESMRLKRAQATGRAPHAPYDVALLAEAGRTGFLGWLETTATAGTSFRFTPAQSGWDVPGIGVLAWRIVELLALIAVAFTRVE